MTIGSGGSSVFGMVGDGFALVVADTSAVNSILVHKSDEVKIMILDSHKLLGASGEHGDRSQFTEYIQKNVALYPFRNGIPLSTAATANFMRGELATALQKTEPALPALQRLIHSTNEEVLTDACWALSYLSDGTNDKIQAVIEANVCLRLMKILLHPSPSVLIPALRTVGNIVTGDDIQTQYA